MANYELYSTNDFLEDEFFIQWVKDKNAGVDDYWENWIAKKPANLDSMKAAEEQLRIIFSLNRIEPGENDVKEVWTKISRTISKGATKVIPVNRNRKWMIAAASVILLLVTVGSYFYFGQSRQQQIVKTDDSKELKNDVSPGGNRAVLTLADGSQIVLDSANNGTLTQQGNTKIIKLDDGELSYSSLGDAGGEILYNTISTPRGGQYQIVLADGSKVWLNAASSLKFPTTFSGRERTVQLTGEGYFEVAPLTPAAGGGHGKVPFIVSVASPSGNGRNMQVEVLGTHFNVNAYDDEEVIKTTLLEGSVKVSTVNGQQSTVIKPGQQAQLQTTNYKLQTINNADVDEAVAWKNGRFIFQGNNIQSVMRQLARWYNVEVSYEGNITNEEFVGVINRSRYEYISQILEMVEKTRTVSFDIHGNRITVMPFRK